MRVKLTAEQRDVLKAKMKEARKYHGSERNEFIAKTIGDVYDVELPVPEVIEAISKFTSAEVGEHVYYLAPTTITKKVNVLTSDCTITQTKVSPSTQTEVTWTDIVSEDVYVCIHDWLKADHDVLQFNADAIQEAMDRQEIYAVLQLVDAGAVSESNVYTLDSGKTKFDYPKLVEMVRSIAKYGRELVLITGGTITTDIALMNYDADKNQAVTIFDVVQKHIPIEDLKVTVGGVEKTVLAANVALLVAVSDSKKNRALIVARRKTEQLSEMSDTDAIPKERVIISSGNGMMVGSSKKAARGFFGLEEYSVTSINDLVYAKFTRSQ